MSQNKKPDEGPAPSMPQYIIGERFEVVRKLGKGGMGEIFLAKDKKLIRNVAVKKISSPVAPPGTLKKRFMREAQTASQIDHQNICTIYEIYEGEQNNFIVMQYIDGVSLERLIKLKKLRVGKVVDICIQLCDGMIAAHSRDVIHRDLKPSNIMIDHKGIVKILDFGLAKIKHPHEGVKPKEGDSHLTQKGFVIGTVAYMSPEQARGDELDLRTDIFSFGCLLYEMLEGKDPFDDTEQIGILYNVLNKRVTFSPKVPRELARIASRALAKNRKKRYGSFEKVKRDLEQFRWKLNAREELEPAPDSYGGHNLMALVSRIKKIDGLSVRHQSRAVQYFKSWPAKIVLLLIMSSLVLFLYFARNEGPAVGEVDRTYILLDRFENEAGEEGLSDMVRFLLFHSLNQYSQFKTIDLQRFSRNVDPVEKFSVKYRLSGSVSTLNRSVNIDAQLQRISSNKGDPSFTVPGLKNRDSLLVHQVDVLSQKVFSAITGKDPNLGEFKKLAATFGRSWDHFTLLFQGKEYFDKLIIGKAETYLRKADDIPISKLYLADLYLFGGRRVRASHYLEALDPQFNDLLPWMQLKFKAMEARIAYDFKEEIHVLEMLKDESPFQKEAFFELGEAYFNRGNAAKAIPFYLRAVDLCDDYSLAVNHLGYCYSHMGDHRRAIEVFERYRDLDRSANSFDSLGDGYFYAGDLVSSEACKRAAIAMEKGNPTWSYRTLSNIYTLKSQYTEALAILQELAAKNKELWAQLIFANRKAFILFLKSDYTSALRELDGIISLYTDRGTIKQVVETHWLKGVVLGALGRSDEARVELAWLKNEIDTFKLSAENYSHPYKFYIHLDALIKEKNGDLDGASKRFSHLMSLKSQLSFRTTYFNYQFFCVEYARFLKRNQRKREALACTDKCLEFSGHYIPALWLKAGLMQDLGITGHQRIYEKIAGLIDSTEELKRLPGPQTF